MKRYARRGIRLLAGALAAFFLACRLSGDFAEIAASGISRPTTALLHRLTSAVPFPVTEPLAMLAAAGLVLGLLRGAYHSLLKKSPKPLGTALGGWAAAALLLGGALVVLWVPACACPVEAPPAPEGEPLEWLCGQLIDQLNASALAFPSAEESLREAPRVAGLPDSVVKAVRYPEWMAACGVSGLFVPLTGEVLVDITEPAPLIPFTAIHELMHLDAIADEGAANIAAWDRCLAAGGAFADSARLWALRYGLGQLASQDVDAWRRCRDRMRPSLAALFDAAHSEALPARRGTLGIPGLALSPGDYAALLGHLRVWNGVPGAGQPAR